MKFATRRKPPESRLARALYRDSSPMSSKETKLIRKAAVSRLLDEERDLPISSPRGRARYLGRPPYFGPFHPEDLDELFECKVELEVAEDRGRLEEALELLGLRSKEQWWHIEASFYQRHLAGLDDPEARQRELTCRARRRRSRPRQADGTPAPVFEATADPPVTFEVYCELAGAQAAWIDLGRDPIAEAVDHFLLEPADLLEADLYWSRRLASDRDLARAFARKMHAYRLEYRR